MTAVFVGLVLAMLGMALFFLARAIGSDD